MGKYLRLLENGLGTGDDSHGSTHSADKRVPSGVQECNLHGVVMLYNIKSLTVDENGNVCGKCHAPCSLKTSFEDFEKVHAHCNRYKYINVMLTCVSELTLIQ